MKASEVLKRYAAGERNFQRLNLRGQSFKGQNLSGANFSEADLRSTNFTNTNLREAKFCGAKAGLQKRWVALLVILSWLLAGIAGIAGILPGALVTLIFDFDFNERVIGWISLIIMLGLLILIIRQGIRAGTVAIAVLGTLAIAGAVVLAVVGAKVSFIVEAVAGAAAVAAVVVGVLGEAISVAIVVAIVVPKIVEVVIGVVLVLVTFGVAGTGTFAGTFGVAGLGLVGVAGAGTFAAVGVYVGWRSMKGDKRDAWIRSFAIAFSAMGGTSFRNADLTEANFTETKLENTDLRETILIRSCWKKAAKLDLVRPGDTYLKSPKIRQLLITSEGQNQYFDHQDLRGVNLSGANLEDASFIDADFYQANLQEANLSRARLVRANFERADLRGANLTGSCIQDWVITESTKLDGIICDYVYLKWLNRDKRDQMPPRGKFKEGGFVTFIRYILETVELYHEKDINPRLALTVLQKMSRDYDEPLDIVAFGKKGEKVFIQVKVSENIARENFKDDYYSRYDTDLKLWSGNIHQLPPAVNNFIEKRISEIASEKTDDFVFVDATYAEGNYTEIYQGEVKMSGDRHIQAGRDYRETHVNDQGTYIEGDYHNNPEQKQNLAQAAREIQQLLENLSETYPTSTNKEKMVVIGEVVDQIESNPTLKGKVINALKAGGTEAFKEAIDHPLVNILVATIEGWQDAE